MDLQDKELKERLELLNQNDTALNDLYRNYAAAVNLSDTALWVLYVAWVQGEGCTQKEICDAWSYPRQTINSALKSLEGQGYLELRTLPGNRKNKRIFFTKEGRAFGEKTVRPLLEAEKSSFGQLDEKEQKHLVGLSQKRTLLLQLEMERTIAFLKRTDTEKGEEEGKS